MKTVLIVDDHADMRRLLSISAGSDFHVLEAEDGESALEAIRRQRPDAVLLDIMMPGAMDGLQVLDAIRADPALKHIRVAMVTARGQATDHEALQQHTEVPHHARDGGLVEQLGVVCQRPVQAPGGLFEGQRQLAVEDDVHLLLLLVAVDPPPLAGLQRDQVRAEAADQRVHLVGIAHIEVRVLEQTPHPVQSVTAGHHRLQLQPLVDHQHLMLPILVKGCQRLITLTVITVKDNGTQCRKPVGHIVGVSELP